MTNDTEGLFLELDATDGSRALLSELPDDSFDVFTAKRADGLVAMLEVLGPLSASIVPVITAIVCEQIRARKYIKVKIDGVEVSGLSEGTVESILKERMDARRSES